MVELAPEAVAGIAVLLAAGAGHQHQILEAGADPLFKSKAGSERRGSLDQVSPLLLGAQENPHLAVPGCAAEQAGPADDQDVGLAQRDTANAQLLFPRIRRIEAGLLNLGRDLPDLGRRDSGVAERMVDSQEAGLGNSDCVEARGAAKMVMRPSMAQY